MNLKIPKGTWRRKARGTIPQSRKEREFDYIHLCRIPDNQDVQGGSVAAIFLKVKLQTTHGSRLCGSTCN